MSQYDWKSHDIKVIFGDMNFRLSLNMDKEHCLKLIK